MSKKHIISLAGDLASGKGTVSFVLSERLNYSIYKNGDYFRELAKAKGMSVTEFNQYVKNHPEIDRKIEQSASDYAQDHEEFIIDARLGWYSVPESFKVYLKVQTSIAAQRAFNDPNRKSTENFSTVEEQEADLKKRYALENERYFKLYGVHKEDLSNYDLVIDTSYKTPEEVANIIIEEYEKWWATAE